MLRPPYRITRLFCLVAMCLFFLSGLTGCDTIQTGIANVIGAPTPAQVRQVQTALTQLDQTQTQLQEARDQAAAQKQMQLDVITATRLQDDQLQKQITSVASQLATTPPGMLFENLSRTLTQLQNQRTALQTDITDQTAVITQWQSEVAKLDASLKSATEARSKANAQLSAFAAQRDTAITATAQGVSMLGNAVQDFGVPGAAPIGNQISGYLATLLGITLAAGGVYAKKKIDQSQQAASISQTAASDIAGSIEIAREANPQLDEALKASAKVINKYQGKAAKDVVDQVQEENKAA